MPTEANAKRDRLTKAAQAVGHWEHPVNDTVSDSDAVQVMTARAEAEAELAAASSSFDEWAAEQRELLTEYGRHMAGCNYPYGKEYGCKCGFLAIVKREAHGEKTE